MAFAVLLLFGGFYAALFNLITTVIGEDMFKRRTMEEGLPIALPAAVGSAAILYALLRKRTNSR